MTAPAVRAVAEGATLKVRVAAGARRQRIVGAHGDALKVSVLPPPEKGKANRAVERLLAEVAGVAPADVTVTHGAASRDKVVLFRGWETASLEAKIQEILVTLGRE